MKVLLVTPSFPGRVSEYLILPSLELCIISSILKNSGHTVKLLDMKINHLTAEDLTDYLSKEGYVPDAILIDDSPETHCVTKKILPIFKEFFGKNVITVLRGEIPSFEPEMILSRNLDLDYITRYDDDYAFVNLINAVSKGESVENIDNIAYRLNGKCKLTATPKRKYSLDSLPMPDRKLYSIDKYLKRDSETIVRSSRGCPGNCVFCIKTRYEQFGVFSVERFVDEIEELLSYGFESFFFSDDTFAFSDKRLADFAAEMRKRNLTVKFTSNIRIKDINEYKIKTLKELGAYRVFVGIETINASSSKIVNKNLNIQEIKEKIAILKKYDMEYHASFILGAPNDNDDDLEATIGFVKEIRPTVITFNMLKAYPGLPLYNDPEKYGIIMEDPYWFESDEWSRRCVIGTKNLPPEKIEKWSRKMLFEFIGD